MEVDGRRRQYSWYQKKTIIDQHFKEGLSISSLARKYGIHPITLYQWKRTFKVAKENPLPEANIEELMAEIEAFREENGHLKKAVAELSVDKAILQETVEILKKKHRARQLRQQKQSWS